MEKNRKDLRKENMRFLKKAIIVLLIVVLVDIVLQLIILIRGGCTL